MPAPGDARALKIPSAGKRPQSGWDVDNRKGYAHAYREGYHEDAVKV
jgi:hypothetical protein